MKQCSGILLGMPLHLFLTDTAGTSRHATPHNPGTHS